MKLSYKSLSRESINWPVLTAVLSLGISSLVTQILVLREFLTVFSGNELTIGLVLGNWLWLTGVGSYLGRRADRLRRPRHWLVPGLITIAVMPPLQLIALRLLRGPVLPGLMMGINEAFVASLLVLLPYCIASGFLLSLFSREISSHDDPSQVGQVYIGDTVGCAIGGILFSSLFVFFLSPLQTAFLLTLLSFAAVLFFSFPKWGRTILAGSALFSVVMFLIVPWEGMERTTLRFLFSGQEIVSRESTPYGQLVVATREGQTTVFQNGVPIASPDNPIVAEETVHYALALQPRPDRVLLVSGSLSGAIQEVLKYPVRQVDCVEADPAVLALAKGLVPKVLASFTSRSERRTAGSGNDPRVHLIADDAVRFLRRSNDYYDAILMNLPDPSTVQWNRFFTREFFALVQKRLNPSGVFSFGLMGAENYAGPEQRLLSSSVYQALKSVFSNARLIPGSRQFFIASDYPIVGDIGALLKERGIATVYVNDDYLQAKLTPDRLDMARRMVSLPVRANEDFAPISAYAHLEYWLRRFEGSGLFLPTLLMLGIAGLLFVMFLGTRQRAVPAALCASGFAGMALELILLIAFQIGFGFVYRQMGLLITMFLIGGAVGAFWSVRQRNPDGLFFRLDLTIALIAFLLVPILHAFHGVGGWLYPILAVFVGFLTGAQFPLAARIQFQGASRTFGTLYAFDLLGACLGALITGVFLVPRIGIVSTLYLIGTIKLTTAVLLKIRKVSTTEVEAALPPASSIHLAGLLFFLFAAVGVLFIPQQTETTLYALSFLAPYHWVIFISLGIGIIVAVRGWKNSNLNRWVYYLLFTPLAFFPIFRCYFKIPFIFCHVCPRPCVFGYLRPYLVPAALAMNLERKYWCSQLCPIGTLHDGATKVKEKGWRFPRLIRWISYAILILTAVFYFILKADHEAMSPVSASSPASWDFYTFFFRNSYSVTFIVVLVALALIVLSFRVSRPFCRFLCPIGTVSDLALRLDQGK